MLGCATIGGFLYIAGIPEMRAYQIGLLVSLPVFLYFSFLHFRREGKRARAVDDAIRERTPVEILRVDPMLRVFEVNEGEKRVCGYVVQATTESFVYVAQRLVKQDWIPDEEEDFLFPGSRLTLYRWLGGALPAVLNLEGRGLRVELLELPCSWIGVDPQTECEVVEGAKADDLLAKIQNAAEKI